jgi:AraC-like DNA-binding protein
MLDLKIYPGGFKLPKGRLTDRLIDMRSPLGLAYERAIAYQKDEHTHDEPHLTFPRGSARLYFDLLKEKRSLQVDRSTFLWMPAGVLHRQGAKTLIWDNFALYPDKHLLQQWKNVKAFPARSQVFKRSRLLEELVNRLFYSRVMCKATHDPVLVEHVLNETNRIIIGETLTEGRKLEKEECDSIPATQLALRYLELNLFSSISAEDLAKAARVSVPTLYRLFNKEFGMTPMTYQRLRRLDEAQRLLESGEYLVQDVARLVGYEDLPSFSKAFKKRFGTSPLLSKPAN